MKDDQIETITMLLVGDKTNIAYKIIQNYFEKSNNHLDYVMNENSKNVILQIDGKKVILMLYDINIDDETFDQYLAEIKHAIAFLYDIKEENSLKKILTNRLKSIKYVYPQIIKAYVGYNSDNGEKEKNCKKLIDKYEHESKNDQYIH